MKMLTIAALLGSLLAAPVMAAQFYKWTDENGVTHYSENPPPATAKSTAEVKVQTRLPSGAGAAADSLQKQRDAASKKNTDAEKGKTGAAAPPAPKDNSKNAERCQRNRDNLAILETNGRVSEKNEKGEQRALTDEEKNQRMDEARRLIKAFCE